MSIRMQDVKDSFDSWLSRAAPTRGSCIKSSIKEENSGSPSQAEARARSPFGNQHVHLFCWKISVFFSDSLQIIRAIRKQARPPWVAANISADFGSNNAFFDSWDGVWTSRVHTSLAP